MESDSRPLQNPPFKIIECQRSSWKELTGDDLIHFLLTVKTDHYSVWMPVPFDRVMNYCKQHHPAIGEYYSSVRRSIKGLGPKHNSMFDIMDAEGFDHLPYIHAYINENMDLDLLHQRELEMQKNAPATQKAASKKGRGLESYFPAMRRDRLRNEAFMDELMEHLNKEALERFPEIFNAEPDLIREFHIKLIEWVSTIGEDMDKLAFKATRSDKE